MNAGYRALIALLLLLLATGCSQQPLRPGPGAGSSLHEWVDTSLAPYVSQQLGQHPRFRGEPVIIVRLDGDDIQPDIDGLTRSIRDQLMDSMLTTPGVNVPWQPQQQPARHHRRLGQVQCGRIRDASYFVGIEITRTATAQYRVAVRALDVQAGEWVSGFSHHWSGSLTTAELRALQERRTDESLRGLRVLPFSAGQPDLAATYLANNLSCLLRDNSGEERLVHLTLPDTDDRQLRTTLELVGNYLARYRAVRLTDEASRAGLVLKGKRHPIHPGLHQIWASLRTREGDRRVDTEAYLRVLPHPSTNTADHRPQPETSAPLAPLLSSPRLVSPEDRHA